ncbi:unnamed protein product [Diamesa serratosioi]
MSSTTSTATPIETPIPESLPATPATSTNESSSEFRSSTQYSFTPAADSNNRTSTKATLEDDEDKRDNDDSAYVCNICLDIAVSAVVSHCGHLFCWPCLNQWLETRPTRQLCPVCKASINKDKVIPLYGRNSEKQQDPRSKVPPRPAGQRTEPEPQGNGFQSFGFGDGGFHLSFGIGAFPFGFFASNFNFTEGRPGVARPQGQTPGTPQFEEDQFLSKVFLWVAVLFITWLILA